MKLTAFNASCPFEIGDKINVGGRVSTITDIMCCHYVASGRIEFRYKLDCFGNDYLLIAKEHEGSGDA